MESLKDLEEQGHGRWLNGEEGCCGGALLRGHRVISQRREL